MRKGNVTITLNTGAKLKQKHGVGGLMVQVP